MVKRKRAAAGNRAKSSARNPAPSGTSGSAERAAAPPMARKGWETLRPPPPGAVSNTSRPAEPASAISTRATDHASVDRFSIAQVSTGAPSENPATAAGPQTTSGA